MLRRMVTKSMRWGILALYSKIDSLQREDHAVTVAEVKEVMDDAIAHSQKASAKKLVKRVYLERIQILPTEFCFQRKISTFNDIYLLRINRQSVKRLSIFVQ